MIYKSGVVFMMALVFVFGSPGSGKTTAARYIERKAQAKGDAWSAFRVNDYKILDDWFRADSEHKRFRPREYDGFDILDPDIYDEALRVLKCEVQKYKPSTENGFVIIEFARCDYRNALEEFGRGFMQDAYFLFIDSDIEACVHRVHERVRHPITLDDHFASEFVLECYRQRHSDYIASTLSILKTIYGIDDQKIRIVDNSSLHSKEDLYEEMKAFVDDLEQTLSPPHNHATNISETLV
jgi:adenylate kinase family enzyme